jgi:hypothetical protein
LIALWQARSVRDRRVCDAMERRENQTAAALESALANMCNSAEAAQQEAAELQARRSALEAEAAEVSARCAELEQEGERLKSDIQAIEKQRCQVSGGAGTRTMQTCSASVSASLLLHASLWVASVIYVCRTSFSRLGPIGQQSFMRMYCMEGSSCMNLKRS